MEDNSKEALGEEVFAANPNPLISHLFFSPFSLMSQNTKKNFSSSLCSSHSPQVSRACVLCVVSRINYTPREHERVLAFSAGACVRACLCCSFFAEFREKDRI